MIYDTNCNQTNFNSSSTQSAIESAYNITFWDGINQLKEESTLIDDFTCATSDAPMVVWNKILAFLDSNIF